jgi:hypothetical protein
MAIWSMIRQFGIFCGQLVYFMVIWYIFSRFGMLYQEKSGNPDVDSWVIQTASKSTNIKKCIRSSVTRRVLRCSVTRIVLQIDPKSGSKIPDIELYFGISEFMYLTIYY